jgi:hypothetical protein
MEDFGTTNTEPDKSKWKAVYTIIERGGEKRSLWLRIGTARVNKDLSLNVKLDAMPTNGMIHIRDYEPPAERLARLSATPSPSFSAGDLS